MSSYDSDHLLALVRRVHGRAIGHIRQQTLSDIGMINSLRRTPVGHGAPRIEARSLLDHAQQIRLVASHDPVADDPALVGNYPTGSKLVFVSVSARNAGTGVPDFIDLAEADAWCRALAPEGYEDYTVRLGRIATSPSNAVHYRQIVGPDNHICVIDERDHATMRDTAFYI